MSEQHPDPSVHSAEVLEQGGGSPTARGSRKPVLLGAAGVVAVGAVGLGAWAAYSFLAGGPQPAEALPAATVAYAGIDLDPAGAQKIEALRFLNRIPAFEEHVGIGEDDDVRERLFEDIGEACAGLSWGEDLEPWLGHRAAAAAVDTGDRLPHPVGVLEVTDATAAEKGLEKLADCGGGEDVGWHVEDGWAVVAETDAIAAEVTALRDEGTLAEDETFLRWTAEAGDPGIATVYVAPGAGSFLADAVSGLTGLDGLAGASSTGSSVAVPGTAPDPEEICADMVTDDFTREECLELYGGMDVPADDGAWAAYGDEAGAAAAGVEPELPEELQRRLEDFGGFAITVRFDGGALEVEGAGDASLGGVGVGDTEGAPDALLSLPTDTLAAVGANLPEGWAEAYLDSIAGGLGGTSLEQLEQGTGLQLPEDLEALLGDSAALGLGPGFDLKTLVESTTGSGVPVAVRVEGDSAEVESVLEKLRAAVGPQGEAVLGSTAEDGVVVFGPDAEYRTEVLEGGSLGDDDAFADVVPDVGSASMVLFVRLSELASLEGVGEDPVVRENLEALSALGISGSIEDGVSHGLLRLTTSD